MCIYSERLPWIFSTNQFSRQIEEKRRAGVPLLDLTLSNPTEGLTDYPHEAIRLAYAAIDGFRYSPNPFGEEGARSALCEWYQRRGARIAPERLLLTASSSESYALLFKLFCNPGDEILAPAPSYPLFEYLAALESVRMVPYRLSYDGAWFIDFADLEQRISSRTRAIVVVHPNNPTGSFLKRWEQDRLIELAKQRELPIICDEVFLDYALEPDAARAGTFAECDSVLSFSLNGLSKSAGMPQMKLGWMVLNGPEAERERARERLEIVSDTYLSVNTPVQRALPELLRIGGDVQQAIAGRTKRNLSTLKELLAPSSAHPLRTEGGWSAIVKLPNTIAEEAAVARLLEEQNVIVQPGYFFDMPFEPAVVVSLLTAADTFEEGVRRLARFAHDGAR